MKLKIVIILSILLVIQSLLFVSFILYYNDKNFKGFVDENVFSKKSKSVNNEKETAEVNDIYFYKTFGSKDNENVYNFKVIDDKIFIVGSKESQSRSSLLLLNFDVLGNIANEFYLGYKSTNFEGISITTFQSNLLVGGDVTVDQNSDIYLSLISNDSILWDIVLGSDKSEISPVVSTLKDGNVFIAFGTKCLNNDAYELAFTTLDKSGDIKNLHVMRGGVKDLPIAIVELSNRIWVIGETKTFGNGASDILIISFSNYFVEWVKTIGTKDFESPTSALVQNDGVLISVNSPRFSVLKLDFDGNIKWVKRYKKGSVVAITSVSNGILAIGPIADPYSINNLFLLETDSEFNVTTEEFFSFNYNELPVGVWGDGIYTYIIGTSYFDATKNDIWIVKLKKITNIYMSNAQENIETFTNTVLSVSNINVEITNFTISSTNRSPFYLYSIHGLPTSLDKRFKEEEEEFKKLNKKTKRKKKSK